MQRSIVSILAAVLMFTPLFAAEALANGTAGGKVFSVTLEGLADTVSRGQSLDGQLTVTYNGPEKLGPRKVRVQAFIETPIGDSLAQSAAFRINPGESRTFPLSFPIDEAAAPGTYRLKIVVSIGTESLSVGHEFEVAR